MVTGAEKLVVQPLRRPGPSFRIESTWPPATDVSKFKLMVRGVPKKRVPHRSPGDDFPISVDDLGHEQLHSRARFLAQHAARVSFDAALVAGTCRREEFHASK